MFERRSLRLPIVLGVVMFVALVALLVGWLILNIFGLASGRQAGLYIAMLSAGSSLLTLAIIGTAMYLTLSIKAINLSRRQSNFIDSVTHELKSPIASIKLYLQTLNRRHLPPAEQEAFFKDMLEDVERLDQLINHLLDAARLEKDRAHQEPEEVDLADLLRRCAAGVCLRYQVPAEVVRFDLAPCAVRAIRVDLELVARNLIDNAVKYADEDQPEVEVVLRAAGEREAVITISDNGRGIPPGQRRRIFGRFVRLGSELVRDKPGMGLGLYIVQTLVSRLGGTIKIVDRDRGRPGTSFEVRLGGRVDATHPPPDATSSSDAEAEVPSYRTSQTGE